MIAKLSHKIWILATALLLVAIDGCDDRATHIAREAADRQAGQNTEMAQVNKEVASGTHQLVEADAKARQAIVGVHRDLQAERTRLDTSWNKLEDERRQIAGERRIESMLVSVCELLGGVLVVVALLAFCWYALVAACRGDATDAELNELLVEGIFPDEPSLLSAGEQNLLRHSRGDKTSAD